MVFMDYANDLTQRQQQVLSYIIEYQKAHAIAPTVREVCAHLGLRSPGGIHRILNVLKEKGHILSEPGKKRAWRFAGQLPGTGIPLVGEIAAGEPIEAIAHGDEELDVSPSTFGCDTCFALRVRGDSMIDAHILDGDIAIIRPQKKVENGEIAAVMVKDLLPEATLKIVHYDRLSFTLTPASAFHDPLVFKGPARKKVTVLGKYIGIIRQSG